MITAEQRIVKEQGLEAAVATIVEPAIEQLGYRLVRVKISGLNGMTVQIMAERPDGTMNVEGCEAVSRGISPVLDVDDPIDKPYHLEVSSPGIDRPLVRKGDFEIWSGFLMKLETTRLINDRKRYRGKVIKVSEDAITVERDQPAPDETPTVEIPFDAIGEARLILTDDLIEASLKADKAARKASGASTATSSSCGSPDETPTVEIPFDAIGEARLILTDDLIEASLKADKAARKASGEPQDDDVAVEAPERPH